MFSFINTVNSVQFLTFAKMEAPLYLSRSIFLNFNYAGDLKEPMAISFLNMYFKLNRARQQSICQSIWDEKISYLTAT